MKCLVKKSSSQVSFSTSNAMRYGGYASEPSSFPRACIRAMSDTAWR